MAYTFQFHSVFAESGLLLRGVLLTIGLSGAAIFLGSSLALIFIAILSNGPRPARAAVALFVELLRNTPFLVQLLMIFFGLPLLGLRLSAVEAALLAMTLNLAAYSTEILRAGVEAVHKSQIEAGMSLAMTRLQVFRHVVIVPAMAKVWPALSSQFVLMLLASSVCSFISVQELSGSAAVIESRTFRSFETYIVTAALYLVLALSLKLLLKGIGKLAFPRVSGLSRIRATAEAA